MRVMHYDCYGGMEAPSRAYGLRLLAEAVLDQDLLSMQKSRNRANAVLELAQKSQQQSDVPGDERTVLLMVVGPDGPVEQKVKISDMLAESAPLEELSKSCIGCAVNLRNVPFGCGGAIHYPISEATERWLVDRLPEKLDEPAGVLLEMAIKDLKITGESVDTSRPRQIIYAARNPSVRAWGRFMFQKKITSSQILQMLFNVGNLQPTHARMMSLFPGFRGCQHGAVESAAGSTVAR